MKVNCHSHRCITETLLNKKHRLTKFLPKSLDTNTECNILFFSALTQALVYAPVISRLDYYNVIVSGLPRRHQLQIVQNSTGTIIISNKSPKNITPVLLPLYWLLILQCIQYKILLLISKALRDLAFTISLSSPPFPSLELTTASHQTTRLY